MLSKVFYKKNWEIKKLFIEYLYYFVGRLLIKTYIGRQRMYFTRPSLASFHASVSRSTNNYKFLHKNKSHIYFYLNWDFLLLLLFCLFLNYLGSATHVLDVVSIFHIFYAYTSSPRITLNRIHPFLFLAFFILFYFLQSFS